MNRRVTAISVGFLALVALTALLLVRVRSNYVLGKPGIKLVNEPIYNDETNIVSEVSAYLPARIGEYRSDRIEAVTTIEQNWLPPDTTYGRRIYTAPDRFRAMVSIVLMGTDRTSIHKPQYCLMGQGQEIVGSEVISIPIEQPHPYGLQVMKLSTKSTQSVGEGQSVTRSGVFMYWFVADNALTPHHGERMWLMGKNLFTSGLLQRWAYVAYFGMCAPGEEEALTLRMKEFIAESVPTFQLAAGERRADEQRTVAKN